MCIRDRSNETRTQLVDFYVAIVALLWSFFIAFCYALASYKTLVKLGVAPAHGRLSPARALISVREKRGRGLLVGFRPFLLKIASEIVFRRP